MGLGQTKTTNGNQSVLNFVQQFVSFVFHVGGIELKFQHDVFTPLSHRQIGHVTH
jgi:hypothetical protein